MVGPRQTRYMLRMSTFWDKLKPSRPEPRVVDLQVAADASSVRLVWEDGQQTSHAARALRQACPCAGCVDEWTNQRTLDVDRVPADLTLKEISPVGNYALSISFSDGHATGIYPWSLLRSLAS